MKNQKRRLIKIKINQDGSIKGIIKNDNNERIGEVTAKNGRIGKIEITRNFRDEAVHITHSAWGNNCPYHEDIKKNAPYSRKKIDAEYIEAKRKERQHIRQIIKKAVKECSSGYKKSINDNTV